MAPRRKGVVPPYDAALKLIDAAAGTEWSMPIGFALATGWRRSEICGLQWSALDLDADQPSAKVVGGLHRVPGTQQLELLAPKTERSARTTPLIGGIVDGLRTWSTRQKKQRLSFGPGYVESDFVFTRKDGRPLDPDSWRRALRGSSRRLASRLASRCTSCGRPSSRTPLHRACRSPMCRHSPGTRPRRSPNSTTSRPLAPAPWPSLRFLPADTTEGPRRLASRRLGHASDGEVGLVCPDGLAVSWSRADAIAFCPVAMHTPRFTMYSDRRARSPQRRSGHAAEQ